MRTLNLAGLLAAASLSIAPLSIAQAQSCEGEPAFAGHRTANGSVRAQYNAVSRGEWPQAIHFGEEVAASGMSPVHKRAAYANLCAAYAASGDAEAAMAACDTAIEMSPDNWRALNNRGGALWLAGDRAAAAAAFQAADRASSGEDEVEANLALSQCALGG